MSYSDADYFSLSEKETREAKTHDEQPVPTLEQINAAILAMPSSTGIELRDRAVIAFILLTGVRDGAVASLKIKHVDLVNKRVIQDAREVRTKFSKSSTTFFFPVGEEVEKIVEDWMCFLTVTSLFGPDDPLFPKTEMKLNEVGHFAASGLKRQHWSNAGPIRRIFKQAFERNGLPYFGPHSFRKTLARLGEKLCRTPEEFKAWSQNMSHEHVSTTLTNYGAVSLGRQAEILGSVCSSGDDDYNILRIARELARLARGSGPLTGDG